MGMVYEAFDRERGHKVALKKLKRFDGQSLLRFKKEFRTLHDLQHPNLVSLDELFEVGQECFFTMELVRGVDFCAYVRGAEPASRGPGELDEARLRDALKGLATGVMALHAADRVHRDIKPSNVLVTGEGRVVLLDFGLATHAEAAYRSTENILVGTIAYMAPEQATGIDFGPAADWYSVGVVLYEALTGRLPHTGGTSLEVLLDKQKRTPAPPRQWNPDVPRDLDELCAGLLANSPGDRPGPKEIAARLGIASDGAPTSSLASTGSSLTQSLPFIGRDAELEELRQRFALSRAGKPALVLLEGASGVGKTRLVEQFGQLLLETHPDAVVLAGRCYERESVPYKAIDGIADDLSRFMRRLPDAEAAALLPVQAGLLPRLFPVLQRVEAIARAPAEREHVDPHEQRRRMFGALRELLVRLAMRHPVVLVIDDLQWTDVDSINLLWDLLGHDDAPALLLIATARPIADPERRQALEKILGLGDTARLRLDELSAAHALRLAELLLPEAPPELLARIARESRGHPLFVLELARTVLDDTEFSGASLDEAMWSRVKALPAELRRILEVISVSGAPIRQELVANALGTDFAQLSRGVSLLRIAHLVRTEGLRRSDTVVCYHDRIRELVAGNLDAEERKHWHGRLAVSLEQAGAARFDPQTLLLHAEAAGDVERAAQCASTAAALAAQAAAFDKAAEFFAVALRLGQFEDEDSRRRLQLQLAEALSNSGRGPEAATVYEEAAIGADVATRMSCRRQAAQQWLVTGHIARGLEALSLSLEEIGEPLPGTPKRALWSLLKNRVRLRLRGMRWTECEEGEIAPTVLNRLDVLRVVGHSLATVDNIRGADFNARFLRLAFATGEPTRVAWAMGTEAVFVSSQGSRSFQRARRLVDEVKRLADARPTDKRMAGWAEATDGWVSYLQGRFSFAEAALKNSALVFRDIGGSTFELNNSRLWRVYCLRHLGALNELRRAVPEYVRDAVQRGDRFMETSLRRYAGRFLTLPNDDPAAARHDLALATWEPPEGSFHLQHWFELEAECEIALYEGRADETAAACASRFEALRRSLLLRIQIVRSLVTWLRARLLLASSPDRAGLAAAWKLGGNLKREHIGYADLASSLVRAAVALRDSHRGPEIAVEHLRDAVALARENRMALHEAAARHHLGVQLGGAEGDDHIAAAAAWMRDQGVADIERMIRIVAPGFDQ